MTIFIGFIVAHLGAVMTAIGGIAAIVGVWLHGKSAGTTQATQAAQAKVDAAQSQTVVARQQAAQAVADAEEAQKSLAAVKSFQQAQTDAAAMTSDQLDAEAKTLGILRKD